MSSSEILEILSNSVLIIMIINILIGTISLLLGYKLVKFLSGLTFGLVLTSIVVFVATIFELSNIIIIILLSLIAFLLGFISGYQFYKAIIIILWSVSIFALTILISTFFIDSYIAGLIIGLVSAILFGILFAKLFKPFFIFITSLEGAHSIVSGLFVIFYSDDYIEIFSEILMNYQYYQIYPKQVFELFYNLPIPSIIIYPISPIILLVLGIIFQWKTNKKSKIQSF
ncbi:hypothetical protein AN641_10150 [Candidatus Epulonipiscioides gigas]|nr:hypothetical protein AN641_10150 [Epulopiscium sp. SCG-C07WGA-EpuloA2]